jgi:hypothetical protein
MNRIIKSIQNIDFTFLVDTEKNNTNFLTVVVSVAKNQEAQFSKLNENSSILEVIAVETAKAINEKFILLINPYDSGIEWRGQFKLLSA